MSGFMAIIASIMMLATTAFGRVGAAAPTGAEKTAAYVAPADNGTQATWTAQNGMDHKTLTAMLTSNTPSATTVLTVGRGGGTMHGGLSGRPNSGHSPMMNGGLAGRPNWGHSPMMNGGLAGRPNWGHRFDSRPFVGRPFDRDDFFFRNHFFPRDRFFDRDDFFFHRSPFFDRDDFFFRNHFFPRDHFFFHRSPFFDRDDFFFGSPFFDRDDFFFGTPFFFGDPFLFGNSFFLGLSFSW